MNATNLLCSERESAYLVELLLIQVRNLRALEIMQSQLGPEASNALRCANTLLRKLGIEQPEADTRPSTEVSRELMPMPAPESDPLPDISKMFEGMAGELTRRASMIPTPQHRIAEAIYVRLVTARFFEREDVRHGVWYPDAAKEALHAAIVFQEVAAGIQS